MPEYKILNQKHECFDEVRMQKLNLLYEGGYDMMDNASLFLKKQSYESQKSFNERLNAASYLPYLSQFIDYFSASLFSEDLIVKEASDSDDAKTLGDSSIDEFYKIFSSDADGCNNSLHNFMKDAFTYSLYNKSYVGVDFLDLSDEETPINLLEQENSGKDRPFLYFIDPKAVIDWKKDPFTDKFQWIKIKYDQLIQDDPLKAPTHKVCFKIWTMKGEFANWARYESKELPIGKEPKANDNIELVKQGITDFKEIPIFDLCVPKGLHVGSKLGPICEEIFNRRSLLVSNMNKTCVSIPYIQLGPEITAPGHDMPSEIQQDPNRGVGIRMKLESQGFVVGGSGDKLSIVEASGAAHALTDKHINDLVDKLHQLVSQMSQSASAQNVSKLNRSGLSKQEDRHSTETLLSAYARIVKDFVKEVYQCISFARGEAIVWSPEGLSTYVAQDRGTIMNEVQIVAGQIPVLSLIPSETFKKKYLMQLANALVSSSSEEEEQIQEEIEKGVENQEHKELITQPVASTGDTVEDEKKSKDPLDKKAYSQ